MDETSASSEKESVRKRPAEEGDGIDQEHGHGQMEGFSEQASGGRGERLKGHFGYDRPLSEEVIEQEQTQFLDPPVFPGSVVYVLTDRTGNIFYVGQIRNLLLRLETHKRRFGADIILKVVQTEFQDETVIAAEKRWIKYYLASGILLANRVHVIRPTRQKRPRLRAEQLFFRTTRNEKESFQRAADVAGQTLSDWLRTRLRQAATSELHAAGESPSFTKTTKKK